MDAVVVRVTDTRDAETQVDAHAHEPIALRPGHYRVLLRGECFLYQVDFDAEIAHEYAVYACGRAGFSVMRLFELRGKKPVGRMIRSRDGPSKPPERYTRRRRDLASSGWVWWRRAGQLRVVPDRP